MRFATFVRNRNSERLVAFLAAIAVLMSLMAVYAQPAQAHHPEITAGQGCVNGEVVVNYTSTSWLTTGASGSGHSDIRIQARANGGTWVEVDSGSYTGANSYSFAGSFDGSSLAGQEFWNATIEVRAYADGPWDNGSPGGQYSSIAEVTVTQDCFNPSCPTEYLEHKVEPVNNGTYGPNDEFTITLGSTNDGQVFDWTSTVPVFQVIAKGGPGANVYDYSGEFGDSGLHAPVNPSNGNYYGLSHISFCYEEAQDQPVEVEVTGGVCLVDGQNLPSGSASVTIDPTSGATVDIYSDAAMTSLVASLTASDTVSGLSPGTYYWSASASSGYELSGDGSGQFTIDDCDVSVAATAGVCLVDDQGQPVGTLAVTIDPDSGATVDIYSDEAMTELVASVGSSGTVDGLEPGTYYWQAGAESGFAIDGPEQGQVTIEDCEATVLVAVTSCTIEEGQAVSGGVDVTIDPGSSATVSIFSDEAMTDLVATATASESIDLAPGTYFWSASAASGFDLVGETTGQFTIDPCEVVVDVGSACVLDGDIGTGEIVVDISVPGGATVVVTDSEGAVVTTLTESATVTVPEGAAYSWSATPASGFVVTGDDSGELEIEECTPPPPADGEIIVEKIVDGDGSRTFEFTFETGGFDLGDDTLAHGQSSSSGPLAPGDGYSVSEQVPTGWRLVSAVCDDGSDPSDIGLSPGEVVTCTFTNTIDTEVQASIQVTVDGSCELDGDEGEGLVDVTMSVPDGATVVISDPDGDVVGTLTSDGTITVPEGATYSWEATANEGFEFPPGFESSGSITIETCSNPDTLPFTGLDMDKMAMAAALLIGTGFLAVFSMRKREE